MKFYALLFVSVAAMVLGVWFAGGHWPALSNGMLHVAAAAAAIVSWVAFTLDMASWVPFDEEAKARKRA